jgi:hypothetical protein
MPAPLQRPFKKAFRLGAYLLAHTLVALLLIAIIEVIRHILVYLGDPELFDLCPLRYIFDLMDGAILVVFLVFGTLEAIEVFKENDDD